MGPRSNQTIPRPQDPFVLNNSFRSASYKRTDVLGFAEGKARLPVPVLRENQEWVEMYWRAWEIAWSNLRRPSSTNRFVSNFQSSTNEAFVDMWESAFNTQYGLYGRRAFDFMGSLDNFYAKQHEDGFICGQIDINNGQDLRLPFDPDSTGPAILSWAEWRAYRQTGNIQRLEKVFWPLVSYHRWIKDNRTWPNGLYWATGQSSGMLNQNRVPEGQHHHRHWAWVDATMQGTVDSMILSKMAVLLGEKELAEELADEHLKSVHQINSKLWDEKTDSYRDLSPEGRFSTVATIGAYWALLDSGIVPEERMEPFVHHLRDENAFKRNHCLPSISAASDGYDSDTGNRWRGGVWAPSNFMVLKGLELGGFHGLAHKIAANHLKNIAAVFEHSDTFWEYYVPESANNGLDAESDYVGWTGLSPIALLIENIIGLHSNWPSRQVTWHRRYRTDGYYGIRNYPLGKDGWLDIEGDDEVINVKTTVPFTLHLRGPHKSLQLAVPAGETEIT